MGAVARWWVLWTLSALQTTKAALAMPAAARPPTPSWLRVSFTIPASSTHSGQAPTAAAPPARLPPPLLQLRRLSHNSTRPCPQFLLPPPMPSQRPLQLLVPLSLLLVLLPWGPLQLLMPLGLLQLLAPLKPLLVPLGPLQLLVPLGRERFRQGGQLSGMKSSTLRTPL